MSDTNDRPEFPDRLSVDPRSPHHVAAVVEHDIGIRFNDKERADGAEGPARGGGVLGRLRR